MLSIGILSFLPRSTAKAIVGFHQLFIAVTLFVTLFVIGAVGLFRVSFVLVVSATFIVIPAVLSTIGVELRLTIQRQAM